MRLIPIAFILLLLPGLVLAKNAVLVIGNTAYETVADLANPKNDATAVARAFELQGFDVTLALDLGNRDLVRMLRAFRAKADKADYVIVYYAGHGLEVAGVNYLVPTDAMLQDERDARSELVALDEVLNQVSGAKRMKMVVLDACRNNPFLSKMRRDGGRGRSVSQGLGPIIDGGGDTLIAFAAAAGAITPDGPEGAHSPFTAAFLKAMRGRPRDVRKLFGAVREEMRRTVPGSTPFTYISLGDRDYIINPLSRAQKQPARQQAVPDAQIMTDYLEADRAGTKAGWNDFLRKYRKHKTHPLYSRAVEQRRGFNQPSQSTSRPPPQQAPATKAVVPGFDPEAIAASVRRIQSFLKGHGCYRGAVDGKLNPLTRNGVDRFAQLSGQVLELGQRPGERDLAETLTALNRNSNHWCSGPFTLVTD